MGQRPTERWFNDRGGHPLCETGDEGNQHENGTVSGPAIIVLYHEIGIVKGLCFYRVCCRRLFQAEHAFDDESARPCPGRCQEMRDNRVQASGGGKSGKRGKKKGESRLPPHSSTSN